MAWKAHAQRQASVGGNMRGPVGARGLGGSQAPAVASMNAERGGRAGDLRPRGGSGERWNDRDSRASSSRSGGMWRRGMRVPEKSPTRGPSSEVPSASVPAASLGQAAPQGGSQDVRSFDSSSASMNQRPTVMQRHPSQVAQQRMGAMNQAGPGGLHQQPLRGMNVHNRGMPQQQLGYLQQVSQPAPPTAQAWRGGQRC